MGWLLWLLAAVLLGIIEVLSVDLFFLMLAAAAVASAGCAALGFSVTAQVAVFAITSFVLVLVVRPWARRLLLSSTPNVAMNVHALIGHTARVTEEITRSPGRIHLDGEIWSARSADMSPIAVGQLVRVQDIDGATAIVTVVENV